VKKLYHFVRTPTWVLPPRLMTMMVMGGPAKDILAQVELDKEENFTPGQIEKFKNDPEFYHKFVKVIEKDINGAFPIVSSMVLSTSHHIWD
jgi:hypothetical protein